MSAKATAITESGRKFDLLIITPAVTIDHSYQNESVLFNCHYDDRASSSSSNGNSTTNLLAASTSQKTPRWRWCTLICAAVKCFKQHGNGNGFVQHNGGGGSSNTAAITTREHINRGFLHTYNITDVRSATTPCGSKDNSLNNNNNNNNTIMYQL